MSSDFAPSPCPILDLGVRLDPGDRRDPWRRMPDLWGVLTAVFGRGPMMAHTGPTRAKVEARIGHYCKCTREAHGPCTLRRAKLCQQAIGEAVQSCAFAPKGEEYAAMQGRITALLRSERHHDELRATRVTAELPVLKMPPSTLQPMPADV